MLTDAHILVFMAERLMQLYCPRSPIQDLTKSDCYGHLMLAIVNRWKISFDDLRSDQTFYLALRGIKCSSAMREILAVFYYALTDPNSTGAMPELYLHIAKKQRMLKTPFWDRFVKEYESAHKPHAPHVVLPAPVEALLKNLSDEQWEEVKRMREEGK